MNSSLNIVNSSISGINTTISNFQSSIDYLVSSMSNISSVASIVNVQYTRLLTNLDPINSTESKLPIIGLMSMNSGGNYQRLALVEKDSRSSNNGTILYMTDRSNAHLLLPSQWTTSTSTSLSSW